MGAVDEWLRAIKSGDRAVVAARLAADPGLAAARDADGISAVSLSVYHGQPEITALLVAERPDLDIFEAAAVGDTVSIRLLTDADPAAVTAYSPDGMFPLGLAAFFGHEDAVRELLARGAAVTAVSRNPLRVTALHSAVANRVKPGIARALIAAGADVNARQRHGWTPLHGAAAAGDAVVVEALLVAGADPSAANEDRKTAADLARAGGHTTVAERLER